MAEADEFVIVLRVRPQASDGNSHAVLQHPVQPGLGTVGLLKVVQELLGSGGQVQFLSASGEIRPIRLDLLLGGLEGWTVEQIEEKLTGVLCGRRPTSCADQLAKAVRAAYEAEKSA